jgi:RNAse (barnase) inhibitor barstar
MKYIKKFESSISKELQMEEDKNNIEDYLIDIIDNNIDMKITPIDIGFGEINIRLEKDDKIISNVKLLMDTILKNNLRFESTLISIRTSRIQDVEYNFRHCFNFEYKLKR